MRWREERGRAKSGEWVRGGQLQGVDEGSCGVAAGDGGSGQAWRRRNQVD